MHTVWEIKTLIILVLIILFSIQVFASDMTVGVRQVIDGDTIVTDSGISLRYIGIDAPEIAGGGLPAEFYSKEALEYNKTLVEGRQLDIEFDKQVADTNGGLLAYVFLDDGTFVNAELIKTGCAWVDIYPPNDKYEELFRTLEKEAREARRGIWTDYDDSESYDPEFVKLLDGFVIQVIDGDTIVLNSKETVRLIGVNAPEILSDRPKQYYGKEAFEFTKQMIENKRIKIKTDKRLSDDYGRLLAYVYLKNCKNVNAELIKTGLARFVESDQNILYNERFIELEQKAKAEGLGIWSLPSWDVDKSGCIDENDIISAVHGTDVNGDDSFDITDLVLISLNYGKCYPEEPYIEPTPEPINPPTITDSCTVYITNTGTKYHNDGCYHLSKSKIPITLREAKEQGYTPCSVCKPPTSCP